MSKTPSWNYFQQHCLQMPELGMSFDTSRMKAPDKLPDSLQEKFSIAFKQMEALEKEQLQILTKIKWLDITGLETLPWLLLKKFKIK